MQKFRKTHDLFVSMKNFFFCGGGGGFSRIHFLENLLIFLCLVLIEFSKKSLLLRECIKLWKTHAPFISMKNFFFLENDLFVRKHFMIY